mmetsp:Transcript_7653/g.10561  ORF Transcript_7653/g.10561 Transcript_7653/m.10561 type:complete len:320 (+) Transcript_7653:140-1099(+)
MTTESPLSSSEEEIINAVLYFSSGLSLLGSLFIIFTYILFKETRTFGTKLIFFLSIADFCAALSWFPWNVNSTLCTVQASILQFSEIASYMWSFVISFSLFQVFFLEHQEEPGKRFVLYHTISWGYPAITVVLSVFFNRFGKAGSWCWIADPRDPFRLFVYGTLVIVASFTIFCLISIRLKMKHIESDFKRILNKRLRLYVLAFLITQLPAVVNRLQNAVQPDKPIFWLFLLQAIFQPSHGLVNCLVYGFSEDQFVEHYKLTFHELKVLCKGSSWCPCCGKRKSKNLEEVPIFNYDYYDDDDYDSSNADAHSMHSAGVT